MPECPTAKNGLAVAIALFCVFPGSVSAGNCEPVKKTALAAVEASIHTQLRDELYLTDNDRMEVSLSFESMEDGRNYPSGPRIFVNYGIRVRVHLKNGIELKERRLKKDIGVAAFSFPNPGLENLCEIEADWVDVPEIVDAATGKTVLDHGQDFALYPQTWNAPPSELKPSE